MEGEVALVFLGQWARGGHGCVLKVTSPPIWLEQRPPVKKWRESKNVTEARAQESWMPGATGLSSVWKDWQTAKTAKLGGSRDGLISPHFPAPSQEAAWLEGKEMIYISRWKEKHKITKQFWPDVKGAGPREKRAGLCNGVPDHPVGGS